MDITLESRLDNCYLPSCQPGDHFEKDIDIDSCLLLDYPTSCSEDSLYEPLPHTTTTGCNQLDVMVDGPYDVPLNSETLDDLLNLIEQETYASDKFSGNGACESEMQRYIEPKLETEIQHFLWTDCISESSSISAVDDGYLSTGTALETRMGRNENGNTDWFCIGDLRFSLSENMLYKFECTPTVLDEDSNDSNDSQNDYSGPGNRFWQYNKQLKGPKGMVFEFPGNLENQDPHEFVTFVDPVFDTGQSVGITHVGRARKGDGNDTSPNPDKLYSIGQEIKHLTNEITRLSKSPDPVMRREKNKLASRTCRLKKKANNEANKIILDSLHKEHSELKDLISQIKSLMAKKSSELLLPRIMALKSEIYKTRVAGCTESLIENTLARYDRSPTAMTCTY